MEQFKNAPFDDDDHGEMPPPSTTMVTLTRTLAQGASCLVSSRLYIVTSGSPILAPLPCRDANKEIVVVQRFKRKEKYKEIRVITSPFPLLCLS
jgi:hypothetical protein